MIDLTKTFYFLFGLLTLIGGIQGFVAKDSRASLIAGGIAGALLLVAGYLLMTFKVTPGLIIGLIVCLALAGRFLPLFIRKGGLWPDGVEGILGALGLLLTIVAFVKR